MKGQVSLAVLFALLVGSAAAANPKFAAVYTFTCKGNPIQRSGPCPNGGSPDALSLGSDGTLYGAAQNSMEGDSAPNGGTIFSLTRAGKFTLLHTFRAGNTGNYPNGNIPGRLMQGPDGKIYGTTLFGGNYGCNGYCGFGVLYRVNPDGSGFKVLHKFCARTNCVDGGESVSGLVLGTDNNLYGTSFAGGTDNEGTIFRVNPATGDYKVVYNFQATTSGGNPSALMVAADGTFYGNSSRSQSVMLFHYNEATGKLTVVALNFPEINGLPSSGSAMTFGPNANLFGLYGVYGTPGAGLFEVQPDGGNLQLFPFYTQVDGAGSPQSMLYASDGNLWIANFNGSSGEGYGDIITLSPSDGTLLRTLAPFSATSAVGAYPATLIQARNGILWGTTFSFGKAPKNHFGDGTVFSLKAGLPRR